MDEDLDGKVNPKIERPVTNLKGEDLLASIEKLSKKKYQTKVKNKRRREVIINQRSCNSLAPFKILLL